MDRTERVGHALARMDHGNEAVDNLWDGYPSFREKYLSRAADILSIIDGDAEPVGYFQEVREKGKEEWLFFSLTRHSMTLTHPPADLEYRERKVYLRPPEPSEEEPEEDSDNPTYMRGWQDAKTDSLDPRSKRPCPGCANGDVPVLLDEDGTKSSVSGNPGRPGHGAGDAYWFCEDFASEPNHREREAVAWEYHCPSCGDSLLSYLDDEGICLCGERVQEARPLVYAKESEPNDE